jgi:hypothetical protein
VAVQLLPSTEDLVSSYLRASADVTALVTFGGGIRIGTVLYAGTDPAIWLSLVTGEERFRNHLIAPMLDIRSYGGTKAQADLLARTVHAVMHAMPGSHDEGVVNAVRCLSLPAWSPDETFTPPRPRYLGTYEVTAHPLPA